MPARLAGWKGGGWQGGRWGYARLGGRPAGLRRLRGGRCSVCSFGRPGFGTEAVARRPAPPTLAVVAAEVEYLSAQLWQLPIMQQALEESEALGHTCEVHRAEAASGAAAARERERRMPFSDGAEQQQLAMILSSIS